MIGREGANSSTRPDRYPHTLRPMVFVDTGGHTDPHLNLALEEHVLRHEMAGDDLLLFYVNAPAIIIGRNQNTVEEISAMSSRRGAFAACGGSPAAVRTITISAT